MTLSISNRFQNKLLLLWHGLFSGGFIVAYLSEDAYAMHVFSGYFVLGIVAVRILAGVAAPANSPLALPDPRIALGKGRNPLVPLFAAAMLASIGLAAVSGWMVDLMPSLEDFHEGASEYTPAVIFVHVGYVLLRNYKKHLMKLAAIAP